jgi:hypothetical protein
MIGAMAPWVPVKGIKFKPRGNCAARKDRYDAAACAWTQSTGLYQIEGV